MPGIRSRRQPTAKRATTEADGPSLSTLVGDYGQYQRGPTATQPSVCQPEGLELRSSFYSWVIMSGISPTLAYAMGIPSIMIGSILLVGAIIALTIDHEDEPRTGVAPRNVTPRKKKTPVRVMPGFLRPWR